jgi:fructose-bisphosphate aldolase, class II
MVETGIDTLAVSCGSVHGQSSRLDLSLLEQIARRTPASLVLHGGSGIHPDDLREGIKMNVVGMDIVRAWMSGVQEGASLESGHEPGHHVMMRHASTKVTEVARRKLFLMGASSHAKPLLQRLEEEQADLSATSV